MPTDHFGLTEDEYVPDPRRDTAALVDGFFEHIAATLREHELSDDFPDDFPDGLVAAMRAGHAELELAGAHRIVDEPARYNLRLTLALVAAYRLLLPRLGRDAAFTAVRAALVEPLGDVVRAGTRAALDAAPDPFRLMVEISKAREQWAFGAGFTFRRPVDDERRYHVDVHRCFYHEVLVASGVPELTPAMCAFDANWIEAIDPDAHGFRFDRVTTIGLGGTHCPFHFSRTGTGTGTGTGTEAGMDAASTDAVSTGTGTEAGMDEYSG